MAWSDGMSINTVNVVDWRHESSIQRLHSFPDDSTGNMAAEALYEKLAKEFGCTADEMETITDDGYYEHSLGMLFLVHSTKP